VIAHVDMDAFYVSIELLRHPELRGKPIVVAYDGPRGVVTTASYEARKYGVHSALPMVTARRRCPDLVCLPVDMQLYRRGSRKVMETLHGFSDQVEVVGMDEAYVDLSGSPVPQSRAMEMKRKVREATRLVCSIGLAPNKLMAKIASDLDKPDGFFQLTHDNWLETVGEKPASLLPGVGPRTFARLKEIGIESVGELSSADEQLLERTFGPKHGRGLRSRANGHGSEKLTMERKRKSESRETTFRADVTDRAVLLETLERLARSVCKSLASHDTRGRTVTLKIRLRPFRTYTRSLTLESPTCDPEVVVATARTLLERFDPRDPVRLIGVGLANLQRDEKTASRTAGSADAPAAASGEGGGGAGELTLDVDAA
jgi:DNA polymerase IV